MISERRHAMVTRYVNCLSGLMNLSHYTIVVATEYDNEERGASILAAMEARPDSSYGTMSLSNAFFDKATPDEQRNTICHELIHLHVDPLFAFIYASQSLKNALGNGYAFFEEAGRATMERMVDQMAYGWAQHLPLPPRFPKQEVSNG